MSESPDPAESGSVEENPSPPLSLPLAGDSSWAGAWASAQNALERLRSYVVDGRPVWWRREPFGRAPYRDVAPKWHVFNGRVRSTDPEDRWTFTWNALCGYSNERSELLAGLSDFKVTSPSKATRCMRCDEALKHIKMLAAEAAAETSSLSTD